ncbi:MAG: AI-2E family transporter [Verrucomicrobia bacterium]|nr:AI-2E family transporter [Verrucomicrobiota bacterium]
MKFDARDVMNWSVFLAVTLALLVTGRSFLIPLAVAILLWSLLNALSNFVQRIELVGRHLPRWLATTFAVLLLLLANYVVYVILVSQADALQKAAPVYQANFTRLADQLTGWLGIEEMPATAHLLERLNVGSLFTRLGGLLGGFIGNIVLVAIYVGFLLSEQRVLPKKLSRLQPAEGSAVRTHNLALEISRNVQRYMWIKTVISTLTGIVAYVILKLVGVDFAATWALIIFFLNYIPNIGSVLGVIFPALLTLVQFETITPFIYVLVGLGSTQFIIGNLIEPAFMGRSLNLSSFVIIISLTFWGVVWGLPGMFLSVPIMVTFAIICSHIPALHWIAVLLSADGRTFGSHEE